MASHDDVYGSLLSLSTDCRRHTEPRDRRGRSLVYEATWPEDKSLLSLVFDALLLEPRSSRDCPGSSLPLALLSNTLKLIALSSDCRASRVSNGKSIDGEGTV